MKAQETKFSIKQVALNLGIHVATVSRLMDSGKLGFYQVGSRRVIGQEHFEKFLSLAERKARASAIH